MKRFITICEYILFFTFLILLFFIKSKLTIFLAIPIILLVVLLGKKIKIKNFSLLIFIIALLIRLLGSFYLKVEIVDDFKTMLEASKNLIKGNFSFLNSFYFQTFSYQLGHVMYQSLLLKIFNKVIFLKIINSIITSLIVVFIYLISRKLFKEKTARIVSLGYLFYFYPIYLNSVLTNQHLPALIYLVVIYFLISKKDDYKYIAIIGILLALSNFFRTEAIIFVLAIIIFNIIKITKKNSKNTLKKLLILLLLYFGINILISQVVFLSPLHTKLSNKAPYWKFYCGLNYEENGRYNISDQEIYFNSTKPKELLIIRIKKDYVKLPILFLKKEVILWTQTNYDLNIKNNFSSIYNILLMFNQGYLNLIIVLFVISLLPMKNRKEKNTLLIKIILALYFLVYMFIEISPRYAYILHILIFLLLGEAYEKIERLLKSRKVVLQNKKIYSIIEK